MRRLVWMVLFFCAGCKPWGPQFKAATDPNHGKRLVRVQGGIVTQWIWDGGDECGSIWGDHPSDAFRRTVLGVEESRYFVRREDAIKWIEQKCPNAIEEEPIERPH